MPSYSPSIAIIDDDEIFQMLVKKILERRVAEDSVLQFSNGSAALLYFVNNVCNPHLLPPVILLDLNMPGMDGWQFLKEFARLQFHRPYNPSVFIISGAEVVDHEKLRTYPVIKGYLMKPIGAAELIQIIQSEV